MSSVFASVFAASLFNNMPANALERQDVLSLSYEQVKGTGLANRCPEVKGEGSIALNKKLKFVDLCLEPKTFQVLIIFSWFFYEIIVII
jgi:photosystem II oxygen-evolving enhancer protein 1